MPFVTSSKAKLPRGFAYLTTLSEVLEHCPNGEGHITFGLNATSAQQWHAGDFNLIHAYVSQGVGGYFTAKGGRPLIAMALVIHAMPADALREHRATIDQIKAQLFIWVTTNQPPLKASTFMAGKVGGVISSAIYN
jgi:hypothetical protein